MAKSFEEINAKIKAGNAVVVTAEEIIDLVRDEGVKAVAKKVDVVTTATFGPMCSSGAMVNFGHSDPPIKISSATLNDVPIFCGLAAVDAYIGATELSKTEGMNYGGAHVIEDLVNGKAVKLVADAYGTDCYPEKHVESFIKLADLNEAYLFNPRNAYQNYGVAVNGSGRTIYTYMGILLPKMSNATYSTSGQLSPLLNDPLCRTIGVGTKIFLGGAVGHVAWQGTQFNTGVDVSARNIPLSGARTLAVIGDLKKMSTEWLRAAVYHRYGVSMFVGIGVPIPILDEDLVVSTSVSDAEIIATIYDYSTGTRAKPTIGQVDYRELRSGSIELNGRKVPTASLSSYARARKIAALLKDWIASGSFTLQEPIEFLPEDSVFKSMKIRSEEDSDG